MLDAINGYKSYIGIVMTILGAVGIFKYITPDNLSTIINDGFQIAGLIVTIIGVVHKDIKLAEEKTQ